MRRLVFTGVATPGRRLVWLACATWAALLPVGQPSGAGAAAASNVEGPYHFGLDFITESLASDGTFLFDFEPYSLTDPGNFMVSEGSLQGRSAAEIQRAVALAIEDAFRSVDTSDAGRTLAVQIHEGLAPVDVSGRRLNVIMGQSALPALTSFGESQTGAWDSPFINNDAYVAAIYLDEIDGMGDQLVDYVEFDDAINAIAGTTAHEIGHVFDAEHVDIPSGSGEPYPLMAVSTNGLTAEMRLTARRFSDLGGAAASVAQLLLTNAGTALRGDFNLDGSVDGLDIGRLVSNFGRTDALWQEGDANGDHRVNGQDIGWLVSQWTGSPPALAAALMAIPEPGAGVLGAVALGLWMCRRW
ncbi:MAG: hypothetical protein KDA61_05860 [Planctomycetales bacterium]|nr:hypothetical protein [Planctomycetales bacterium]